MGFQSRHELEAELSEEGDIPPDLLEDRVDQHRLAARPIAQQIGVGRGLRVEQLTEYQHLSPRPSDRRGAILRGSSYLRHAAIGGAKKQAPTGDNRMALKHRLSRVRRGSPILARRTKPRIGAATAPAWSCLGRPIGWRRTIMGCGGRWAARSRLCASRRLNCGASRNATQIWLGNCAGSPTN